MQELREVASDAGALAVELARANRLPSDFPIEQLQELLVGLQSLPAGTAEGCRRPLEYARARLPAVRRQFIKTEVDSNQAPTDGDLPPPLTRGMTIDLRVGALVNSITTALDEYRALASVEDDDATDTAPSVEIDATSPDVARAMAASLGAERTLGEHVEELERIAEPGSVTADHLKRQMRDARGLLSLARIELRMPAFVPQWYRKTVDTITDYPRILRTTANAMQIGVDLSRVVVDAWHHFEHGFTHLVLGSFEKAATDLMALAGKWEKQRAGQGEDTAADDTAPPPDFDLAAVHEMILNGKTPPFSWRPWITALSFSRERNLSDLTPLENLFDLEDLDLTDTQVSDLTPLANLIALRNLRLVDTHVSVLTPLANLTALNHLGLAGTEISDVSPLENLIGLQYLDLAGTHVSDLAPLANLMALEYLGLSGTRVSDVALLSHIPNLEVEMP